MNAGIVPLPYDRPALGAALGDDWQEILLAAHHWATLARELDTRMLALQRQGRIGFYGPATGQEAVSVAAGLASRPEDWVVPGLREQLVALVRGHSLTRYLHHLFANDRDPARGRQMPCHPSAREVKYVSMSSVVGTQISHAVGIGYALKLRKDTGAALGFFGDGATSTNDFHAGLNFASVFSLPVLFCLTNNQWAISVPVERQSHVRELVTKAGAYAIEARAVDGTDFVACFSAFAEALEKVRTEGRPRLLEFRLFRMTPHSSSDDPSRYQAPSWMPTAIAHDPVARLEELLTRHELLAEAARRSIQEETARLVKEAIAEAEAVGPPVPESMLTDVLATSPPGGGPGSEAA
ncbi:MAG TPA: thiamine pyrophosphate-dependent enzyme [Thermoplasmata archaeon]|nr:thiamine pyrophosphate-dependent enzyme [Thermoplasmata archaeon]